jgi:radical SAM protein with 4Fe4S-binding SPASM domain
MTDGHIAPCPVMIGMRQYYVGHINTIYHPHDLPKVDIGAECKECHIRTFCGGKCLYANIVQPWNENDRRVVCETVENLYTALTELLPQVRSLIDDDTIAIADFSHEKFNGCEIIP